MVEKRVVFFFSNTEHSGAHAKVHSVICTLAYSVAHGLNLPFSQSNKTDLWLTLVSLLRFGDLNSIKYKCQQKIISLL